MAASEDRSWSIWDVDQEHVTRLFRAEMGAVRGLAMAPDQVRAIGTASMLLVLALGPQADSVHDGARAVHGGQSSYAAAVWAQRAYTHTVQSDLWVNASCCQLMQPLPGV